MSASLSLNRRVFLALSVIASAVLATIGAGTASAQQLQDGQYTAKSVQIRGESQYSVSTNGSWFIERVSKELPDPEETLFCEELDFRRSEGSVFLGKKVFGQSSGKIILQGNAVRQGGLGFVDNLQVFAPIEEDQYFRFSGAAVYSENELGLLIFLKDLNTADNGELREQARNYNFLIDGWEGQRIDVIDVLVKARLRPNWMWIYLRK